MNIIRKIRVVSIAVLTMLKIIQPAHAGMITLNDDFFIDAINIYKQKDIPAFARKYGFIQETDPDRREFFQNDGADATIQILSPGDGYFIVFGYDTLGDACEKAEEIATKNLTDYNTSMNEPYWENEVIRVSKWQATHKNNHVTIYCTQYDEDGSSSVEIRVAPL